MLFEVKDLVAGVGDEKILKDVQLRVAEGESYMVFGPNGSGKTVLIMTILGDPGVRMFSGSIRFRGKEISGLPIAERVKMGIGVGFQIPPEVTGVKLKDMLKICSGKGPEDALGKRELGLVKKLKLTDFLDRDVNRGFSGGEKKRAEVLQLLLMEPKLMLLDEPDSGVDLESLKLIGRVIDGYIKKAGASALIVTHSGEIMKHVKASHACVLIGGKSHCYKGPQGILKDIQEHGYRGCVHCRLRKDEEKKRAD